MRSIRYGNDSIEHWAVRISANGECIHQNENTIDQQGHAKASHRCINLSAVDAGAYYNSAMVGDPIEVTGTSVPLSRTDGDAYDWTIPWSTWLTLR